MSTTPDGSPLPAAVLWDLDGTLVDTEPAWIASEHRLIAAHGGTWTDEDALALVGSDLLDSAAVIRERGGVDLEPPQIVEHLVADVLASLRRDIAWRPGARELLGDLRAAGVPCALVTMSYRVLAEAVVQALPPDTFAAVVTGDEVTRGKPDPEPYLRAGELLGVDLARCVVVEDSLPGTRSGQLAGAQVLAVPNAVAVPAGERVTVLPSLQGLRAADLRALLV